jgi:plasmid rolling circle replication initiator protein Rep
MTTGDSSQLPPADTIYLSEVSAKDKPWDAHRAAADKISSLYEGTMFQRYAERIAGCSPFLDFSFVVDPETGSITLDLANVHFCRVRYCTVCQWRRQLKWRARFFNALPKILGDYPKIRFIFLTLTVKNCPVDELRETLAWMNKSWERLSKRKQFPALGWLKSVEVTRGKDGTAHPHFHAILAVNESYFKRGYLSKEKWIQLWRESLRAEYDPSIAVKVVKSTTANPEQLDTELMKGFCEVLKYSLKPDDLIVNQEWLLEITAQLHKTRAVAVGGIFRDYISDKEPEDLITEVEESVSGSDGKVRFAWRESIARYFKLNASLSD